MEIDLRAGEVCLQENQPIRLLDACGIQIICTSGTIWITVTGLADDIFLTAGQCYTVCQNQLTLVESIGFGRIRLSHVARFARLKQLKNAIFGCSLLQPNPGWR